MKRILHIVAFGAFAASAAFAHDPAAEIAQNPDRAGGVMCVYPTPSGDISSPPEGFEPFYISLMARHGSRYLINPNEYLMPLTTLAKADSAGVLTPLGRSVYARMQKIASMAAGRYGDLTPLGNRQHHDIAVRMFRSYPQVFEDSTRVSAVSTMVMRSAMSMAAFCEGLKECNPALRISREPSEYHAAYINWQSPEKKKFSKGKGYWRPIRDELTKKLSPYRTVVPRLISDTEYISESMDAAQFAVGLFAVATSMQNLPTDLRIDDVFTPEELYDSWQIDNVRNCISYSNYAPSDSSTLKSAAPLLNDIVTKADLALSQSCPSADLRFGHDTNIFPLAGLIGLEDSAPLIADIDSVADVFQNYNISPMASNIQLIFFKNDKDDVLVKFMLNEQEKAIPVATDNFPFYRWNVVRPYLQSLSHPMPE